ncbi:tryptophan transporter [Mesobacillus zeae]|uniref:Tryptophan transporter n=1 Tax=Mesobacillus zeae TaxID=1917180 RepID=A0A398B9P7_9BACI|nr:tryptophan transporter [Mesobacillus zeae]RID84620.1 tryptophan transporter [Mesobacillus zeae]
MNTKNLVVLSLLIGMGAVLHTIVPGLILGMKPDMMLTMMFLGIVIFPEKKSVFLAAAVTGVLSGLTSTFPGGLLPNIIDKLVTAYVFYSLMLIFKKHRGSAAYTAALTAVGTIVSGTVFLAAAYYIVGLPGAFAGLFAGAVLPAALFNTIFMIFLFPIASGVLKKTKLVELK